MREKYNPDDLFKNKKLNNNEQSESIENINSMIVVKEQKWYTKIFNIIKNIFSKKKQK